MFLNYRYLTNRSADTEVSYEYMPHLRLAELTRLGRRLRFGEADRTWGSLHTSPDPDGRRQM